MSEYGIETIPSSAATVTSLSLAPTSSPVKVLRPPMRLARAHPRALPHEAAEVLRLGQRALRPGRGHLEAVVGEQVTQVVRHALAERQIDPDGLSITSASFAAGNLLGEQHFDVRLGAGEPLSMYS